jgi:hypothetical protein
MKIQVLKFQILYDEVWHLSHLIINILREVKTVFLISGKGTTILYKEEQLYEGQ